MERCSTVINILQQTQHSTWTYSVQDTFSAFLSLAQCLCVPILSTFDLLQSRPFRWSASSRWRNALQSSVCVGWLTVPTVCKHAAHTNHATFKESRTFYRSLAMIVKLTTFVRCGSCSPQNRFFFMSINSESNMVLSSRQTHMCFARLIVWTFTKTKLFIWKSNLNSIISVELSNYWNGIEIAYFPCFVLFRWSKFPPHLARAQPAERVLNVYNTIKACPTLLLVVLHAHETIY